jgi:hypothetical protein
MAVIILPDAQADLLSLQDYMLDKWGEVAWLKAEDEILKSWRRLTLVFSMERLSTNSHQWASWTTCMSIPAPQIEPPTDRQRYL